MRNLLFVLALLLFVWAGYGQKYHPTIQAVRDTVERWNYGFQQVDPKAMSQLVTDEVDYVDGSGEKFKLYSRDEYEKMWHWAFKNVYHGKPHLDHDIDSVRFIAEDVAIVHATVRTPPIADAEGRKIPRSVRISTFVLVKKNDQWLISSHNENNLVVESPKSAN